MKDHTSSAPGKQGGVGLRGLSKQEIFMAAYVEGIAFRKAQKSLQNSPRMTRIELARLVVSARESEKFPQHAANVILSLLGVKGGAL